MASNISVAITIDNKQYIAGINTANNATKSFANNATKSLNDITLVSNNLISKIGGLKSAIAGLVSATALQQANAFANEIKDISETADVSIASVLALSKAFQVNGGTAEGANNAILKFGETIGSAVGGSDSAQKALKNIGISLKDIQTLGQQELLQKAIAGIAGLESAAMRAKAQMEVFGKGAKSVNFPGVQADFKPGGVEQYSGAIKAGSDASEQMAKNMNNLKLALLAVAEPLNKMIAGFTVTVDTFKTLIQIVAALGASWLIFSKAIPAVYSGFDLIGKSIKAVGGLIGIIVSEIAAFGGTFMAVFANLGKAVGIGSTVYGGLASLSFALSGVLRLALRFAGWVGIIFSVGEAINWLVKQFTGFDVLDYISKKFDDLYEAGRKLLGLQPSKMVDQDNGETQRMANRAKSLEEEKKAREEAAAKAKEFSERYAKMAAEVAKTGDAFKIAGREQQSLIQNQIELVGKSEEEVAMANGLEEVYRRIRDTVEQLVEKRKEWSKGTEEQQKSVGLIDKEIERVRKLGASQVEETRKYITELQTAQLLEKDRKNTLDNIVAAMEQQAKIQEALSGAKLSMIGQQQDVAFQGSLLGKSPIQKQMAQYREDARKAALEAGRAFSQAFEDGGDGLTPERARELAEGLQAIEEGYRGIADSQQDLASKQREFSTGWAEAFAAYVDSANNASNQARSYFDTFTRGFEDAIVNFVQTGKLSFKDLANTIIAEFARVQAKNMISSVFGGGGGGSVTAGPLNILGSIGKIFGFANGGYPPVNRPSIVGERGPELFVPRNAGTIIPNNQLGGNQIVNNSTAVSYQIHAVDAASFKTLLARDPEYLYQVTQAGRRNLPIGSSR